MRLEMSGVSHEAIEPHLDDLARMGIKFPDPACKPYGRGTRCAFDVVPELYGHLLMIMWEEGTSRADLYWRDKPEAKRSGKTLLRDVGKIPGGAAVALATLSERRDDETKYYNRLREITSVPPHGSAEAPESPESRLLLLECGCPRKIRATRSVVDQGHIMCAVCGGRFELTPAVRRKP